MPNVCILTDSTVQFTRPNFPGHDRVHTIPFTFQDMRQKGAESWSRSNQSLRLVSPTPQDFIRFYADLSRKYDTILVLTISSLLDPTANCALSAAKQFGNHARINVVDSKTTGIGLGLLVQTAAASASAGASPAEIERRIRATIPRIYMLLFIPELTCLANSGFMNYSQALVGEMMGLLPIFGLEEGRLAPIEKVRSQRHLFESFLEFIIEFDSPACIALMRGRSTNTIRSVPLREYVHEAFPDVEFSEHEISPRLAALFGAESTGLIIMEKVE
jgi:DegV family protein with EDD domain